MKPDTAPRELTVKAVILGLFLSLVFGAANAYLGLKAGQTVSATIPAAVIAMAIFRLPWFKGTVLEQNIARTAASVGEALVAGAIFTLPAFVITGMWTNLKANYWEASAILCAGGLIGVFFIILLRRPLCVEANLPWPESVASVEIVKAGQAEDSAAPRLVFGSMALGALIQVFKSDKGIPVMKELVEGFLPFPKAVVTHFGFDKVPLGKVTHLGGISWATPALSPALIGIGYIIGPEYASVTVAGGVLAWWVLIPLLLFFDPDFATRLGGVDKVTGPTASFTIWYNVVRPLAVGMMLVAAARTLFSMRAMLVESLRGAWNASRNSSGPVTLDPTEQDIPPRWVIGISVVLTIALAGIYHSFTKEWPSAIAAAIVMAFAGFVLSAVGGYLGGLVGVSNQPTSGLTLSALVLAALVMISMGVNGPEGVAAVLGVAGVVCVAVSTSGSLLQDLKAGHLLGGTPWKMQVVEIIAVVVLSFFLLGPIIALHEANLATGGIGGRDLPAPQAGLMAQLAVGIVNGDMAWGLLGAGAALGVALILCGAKAPMLIAVGMYLPFDTSAAIFAGGAIQLVAQKFLKSATIESKAKAEETGTLLASGLIAGEAIAGIILAVTFLAGLPYIAKPGLNATMEAWLSLVAFAGLAALLIGLPAQNAKRQKIIK